MPITIRYHRQFGDEVVAQRILNRLRISRTLDILATISGIGLVASGIFLLTIADHKDAFFFSGSCASYRDVGRS